MEQVAQLVSEQVSDVYRVLIVDGDENLLALDRLALSKNGFEDETATSATDAPGMMADRMPDLVVLGADDFPTYSGIPEAGGRWWTSTPSLATREPSGRWRRRSRISHLKEP